MKRTLVAGFVFSVSLSFLAACSAVPEPAPDTTTAPVASSEPSAPATAEAPAPALLTCDDLVSAGDAEKYAAAGWTEVDDFIERQTAEGSPNVAFVDYGGALCLWGYPHTDAADVVAGSAIDGAREAGQRARLAADGFVLDRHNDADRYSLTNSSNFNSYYLFVDGYWFFANSESALDRIRQNADVG